MITSVLAASLILSGGVSGADGIGESRKMAGFLGTVVASKGIVEASVFYDSVNKLETEDGGRVGATVLLLDRSGFSPVAGIGYRYRYTSKWSKDSVWGRLGLSYKAFRVECLYDMTSINKERGVEAMLRLCEGRFCGEQVFGRYSYLQSGERMSGYAFTTQVGIRIGR